MITDHLLLQDAVLRVRCHSEVLEHEVLGDTEIKHETMLLTVLRNRGNALVEEHLRRLIRDILAVHEDLTARRLTETGEDLDEL